MLVHIRHAPSRGRGVFATAAIEPNTVVERSPALLFGKDEYSAHGKHTLLDHYTFAWPDGRMALALGIGSLFNHSARPNTSFAVKPHPTEPVVEFTVLRRVEPGEELCIFYAHSLWFTPDDPNDASVPTEHQDDAPFDLLRLPVDEEPEDSVETLEAWVVNVEDTKDINPILEWTRKVGLDRELRHLKRIRRVQTDDGHSISILLCASNTPVPELPPAYAHLQRTTILAPSRPAVTMAHLALKNTIWPTVYAPVRPDPDEARLLEWSADRRQWVAERVREVIAGALAARRSGELPIAALLPREPDLSPDVPCATALTHDTRTSERHPLRHAVINLVRLVGALQTSAEYFLTGRTLFLTHEPCVMCAMALVHSRVRDVFVLRAMPRTGGAGREPEDEDNDGRVMVVALPNINHRYRVWRWTPQQRMEAELGFGVLDIPDNIDA